MKLDLSIVEEVVVSAEEVERQLQPAPGEFCPRCGSGLDVGEVEAAGICFRCYGTPEDVEVSS